MGIRGLAVAVALAAAAGAAAWLLLGSGAGAPNPAGSGAERGSGGTAVLPGAEGVPDGSPAGAGRVEGLLLRDGRPHPGTVTAWLVDSGPPDPASWDSWDDWWDRGGPLFAGIDPAPRATAAAGADGKWSMAGLGPGVHHFLAAADGGLRGRGTEDVAPSGTALARKDGTPRDPLRIDLEPAPCVLRGRILLEGGNPWKGFGAVRTGTYHGADPVPVAVDAEGRFQVADLPPGRVRVAALVPGSREIGGPWVLLPCPVEVVFVVGAGAGEIPARVVEDVTGTPVAGALVQADFDADEESGGEAAVSDAEGRLRLHPPAAGTISLQAEAKGFRTARMESIEVPPADPAGIVIRLRRPAALSGRVIATGTGAPVAGARVVLGDEGGERRAEALSGPDGRYAMKDLDPGPATLRATGDGWISRSLAGPGVRFEEVLLVEGGAVEADIVVVAAPRVRGRILDAEGRPAAGIRVRFAAMVRDGVPGELDTVASDIEEVPIETAADGAFRTPCLVPWIEYTAVALVKEIPLARAGPLVLHPGEEQEVEIRLPPERFLDVRVLAGEGGPSVEGASVEVYSAPQRSWDWENLAEGTLPPEGSLRLGPLPAGPLHVKGFAAAGGAEGEAEVAAGIAGGIVVVLETQEVPGARTVEGRAVLPDGSPAAGASVVVTLYDEEGESAWSKSGESADFRGAFRIEKVPPGSARVHGNGSHAGRDHSGSAEVPSGGGAVEVVLQPGDAAEEEPRVRHRFAVRVSGPDGVPVPRAGCWVRTFEGGSWTTEGVTVIGGEGVADLRRESAPRTAFVEVFQATDASGGPLALAHGVFGPFDAAAGIAEVRLAPEASIEGRVLTPSGEGVEFLKVVAEATFDGIEEAGDWSAPYATEALTGPGGRFRLARLGPGPYRLLVTAWPAFAPAEPVVARGGATGVDLRLRTAVAVTIKVLDSEGRPVEGVSVDASGNGGASDGESVTGPTGTVRLHGLDPEGEYGLTLRPPPPREDLLRTYLKEWKPTDAEFRLARAHVLEVLVQDPSGRPIPGASVDYQREGDRRRGGETTDEEGIARLERLAVGRVVLRAWLQEDVRAGSRVEASASASAGKVVMVLDPGLEVRIPGTQGNWRAWLLEPGDAEPSRHAQAEGGEVRIRGLREGIAYTVYLREQKTGRFALLRGVAAGGEPRPAEFSEGMDVRIRALLPEEGRILDASVLVDGAELITVDSWNDGDATIHGVPPGRWTVRVRARIPGTKEPVVREATVEAGAADPVEIEFPR